jgi:hypothetical protein
VTGSDGDGKSGDGSGRRKEVGQFESPMPFYLGTTAHGDVESWFHGSANTDARTRRHVSR